MMNIIFKIILGMIGLIFLFVVIVFVMIPSLVQVGILPPELDMKQIIECVILHRDYLDGDEKNPTLVGLAQIHYDNACVPIGFDK